MQDRNNELAPSKNSALSATAIGTILMGLAQLLPSPYKEICSVFIPAIAGILSFLLLYSSNRWMEPHAVVAYKAGLKEDLKEQQAILDDPNINEETRAQATLIYSKTRMKLATARQDYASGKINLILPNGNN
ncbi:hypothetical protein [Xenorhabdus bovienii]|uniref:hypothetical protein n=1 Tax=Xenorhabdus bovienii TaxID=40576 RepID=UPI003DA3F505